MERKRYPPMLLTKVDALPVGERWIYEPKLDGYRIVAYNSLKQMALRTRGEQNVASDYGVIAEQLRDALGKQEAVVDGELVAFYVVGVCNSPTLCSICSNLKANHWLLGHGMKDTASSRIF